MLIVQQQVRHHRTRVQTLPAPDRNGVEEFFEQLRLNGEPRTTSSGAQPPSQPSTGERAAEFLG